jgi:hypothetical protein
MIIFNVPFVTLSPFGLTGGKQSFRGDIGKAVGLMSHRFPIPLQHLCRVSVLSPYGLDQLTLTALLK